MKWNSDEKKKNASLNTKIKGSMLHEKDLNRETMPGPTLFKERSKCSKSSRACSCSLFPPKLEGGSADTTSGDKLRKRDAVCQGLCDERGFGSVHRFSGRNSMLLG
jgi:hypothetical protein